MELHRTLATLGSLALVALATGCRAPATRSVPEAPTSPTVGMATVRAAELPEAEGLPKIGKPQYSVDKRDDDAKDAPVRRHGERPGSGFSGYK